MKALLVAHNVEFPYVHDLAHLVSLLEETGTGVPEAIRRADELTPYAVLARYPGIVRPVTERDRERALAIAEAVVRWVEEQL